MAKQSAGLMMYRCLKAETEVFLVHPGGPYWAKQDRGAWSIPKGEYTDSDDTLVAAQREFTEETGFTAQGPFHELGAVKQKGGKVVTAWAFEGNCDPQLLRSNHCQIEWPPRSKRLIDIPEVDRGDWFTFTEAKERILKGQQPFLERLQSVLASTPMEG
jgi:predicted NUDIX family NTP pyrophosphohydrolase